MKRELKKPEIDYDAFFDPANPLSKAHLTVDEIRAIELEFYVTRMDEDYKRRKRIENEQGK